MRLKFLENLQTLVLSQGPEDKYVRAALKASDLLLPSFQDIKNVEYGAFSSFSLIVLNQLENFSSGLLSELQSFVNSGGNLLIVPRMDGDAVSLNSWLQRQNSSNYGQRKNELKQVAAIVNQELVFKDVFENQVKNLSLPQTNASLDIVNRSSSSRSVMTYRDGSPYLIRNLVGAGNIYLLASSFDLRHNNLVDQAEIFVPMLYRMAITAGSDQSLAMTLGQSSVYPLRVESLGAEEVFKLRGNQIEMIPRFSHGMAGSTLYFKDELNEAGFYDLFLAEDLVAKIGI